MILSDKILEKNILGTFLSEERTFDNHAHLLSPELFYNESNRLVYEGIKALHDKKAPIDITTLCNELRQRGTFTDAGGQDMIFTITQDVYLTGTLEYHIRILTQFYLKRRLFEFGQNLSKEALDPTTDVFEMIDNFEKEGSAFNSFIIGSDFEFDLNTEIKKRVIQNTTPRETWITGVPSSFDKINSVTRGFQKGDLILVAARPSMGKTAFCIDLALHAARSNYNVCFFSLEMGSMPIYDRMLQNVSGLDWDIVVHQSWNQDELKRYQDAGDQIGACPLYINTQTGNVNYIKTVLRERKKKYGVDICVIDYLQLIPAIKGKNKNDELDEIAKQLKAIAKEIDIPIIAICSMNRGNEARTDKRTALGDLRDSGSLEYHADMVFTLYRPSYYNELENDKDYNKGSISEDEYNRLIEIAILKHRNGAIGKTDGYFYAEKSQFKQEYEHTNF